MRDYDVKFNLAIDEQRLFIDEISTLFNINKLRNELDISLDKKIGTLRSQLTQDSLLYIQKMLTQKFLEEPSENMPVLNAIDKQEVRSQLVYEMKDEIEKLKKIQS